MKRSGEDDCSKIIPHRASGYWRTPSGLLLNSPLADTSNKVPGGGLRATAGDVVSFAAALDRGLLLKPETIAQMTTQGKTTRGKPTGYGLGFHLSRRDDVREVWHSGGQPQVSTLLYNPAPTTTSPSPFSATWKAPR